MLSCTEFEILLADWLDETLALPERQAERNAFLGHLESCAACALLAENARFAISFMDRAAEVECPPELIANILLATNTPREVKLGGSGISGWINRLFAPVLQPRFVMGLAMTLMSLAILARGFSVPVETFTASDIAPRHLWNVLDSRTHRVWDRAVKRYETTPLIYEVKNQIDDWTQQRPEDDIVIRNENRN